MAEHRVDVTDAEIEVLQAEYLRTRAVNRKVAAPCIVREMTDAEKEAFRVDVEKVARRVYLRGGW